MPPRAHFVQYYILLVIEKKRKLSNTPPSRDEPGEDTDFKLAKLSSMHPSIDLSAVLDLLLAHDGPVEETSEALTNRQVLTKKSSVIGYQGFLTSYITMPADELLEELLVEAPTYQWTKFKLFDNVVPSPHTNCFYIEVSDEQNVHLLLLNLSASTQQTSQTPKVPPGCEDYIGKLGSCWASGYTVLDGHETTVCHSLCL
ncbi:hypothetical protein BJ878DRAFT_480395 [Calycina marina]|uniref:CUE domain-containing protein n=1 Tax=Calycina marina TaxID=1763456 RepID=A0A9P7Z2G5_9HELO|nr:hypothetical protein BJ878DRAFT_480395 [Calycina marina]